MLIRFRVINNKRIQACCIFSMEMEFSFFCTLKEEWVKDSCYPFVINKIRVIHIHVMDNMMNGCWLHEEWCVLLLLYRIQNAFTACFLYDEPYRSEGCKGCCGTASVFMNWNGKNGKGLCHSIKHCGIYSLLEEDIYFLAGVCLPFSLLMEGK